MADGALSQQSLITTVIHQKDKTILKLNQSPLNEIVIDRNPDHKYPDHLDFTNLRAKFGIEKTL